jgi:hypothetical protein
MGQQIQKSKRGNTYRQYSNVKTIPPPPPHPAF